MRKLLFITLLIVLGVGSYLLTPTKTSTEIVKPVVTTPKDCSVTDIGVINSVNDYRSKIGVSPLVFVKKLDDYAGHRALEQNGKLDNHAGLKGAADLLGYQYVAEDQNFIEGCRNSASRVGFFRSSDKHWKSLMNSRYKYIGVGYYKSVLNINLGY